MIKRINALPTSLKVVVWVNLVIGVIGAVQTVASMQVLPLNQTVVNGLNFVCCVLVVLGILQKSRFIRILTLILSWLAVVLLGVSAIIAFFVIGLQVLAVLIPVLVSGATIWGLTTKEANIYFGLDKPAGRDCPPELPETSLDPDSVI